MRFYINLLLIFFLTSCSQDKQHEYSNEKNVESIKKELDELLELELKCKSINYYLDESRFDSSYVYGWLEFSANQLVKNDNDDILLGKQFESVQVPKKWIAKNNFNQRDLCSVFLTKILVSKDKKLTFTYVWIPSLDRKYKVLMVKRSGSGKWELLAFG